MLQLQQPPVRGRGYKVLWQGNSQKKTKDDHEKSSGKSHKNGKERKGKKARDWYDDSYDGWVAPAAFGACYSEN